MTDVQKYCLQDKRVSSTAISSFLNDADISVSSKTIEKGLGSNPGEDMDVCKCIVPLRCGGLYIAHDRCRLEPGSSQQPRAQYASDKPNTPPSRHRFKNSEIGSFQQLDT
ncbi:hypothetical protein TNCV_2256511 [Trichonephila clavipes]|nr:hypothetical protein TNCV_2256511 [Trichonephila clavipes]